MVMHERPKNQRSCSFIALPVLVMASVPSIKLNAFSSDCDWWRCWNQIHGHGCTDGWRPELLGAEVWEAGKLNMSQTHPLYQGSTGKSKLFLSMTFRSVLICLIQQFSLIRWLDRWACLLFGLRSLRRLRLRSPKHCLTRAVLTQCGESKATFSPK